MILGGGKHLVLRQLFVPDEVHNRGCTLIGYYIQTKSYYTQHCDDQEIQTDSYTPTLADRRFLQHYLFNGDSRDLYFVWGYTHNLPLLFRQEAVYPHTLLYYSG